jgi:hypothetical protein
MEFLKQKKKMKKTFDFLFRPLKYLNSNKKKKKSLFGLTV